MRTLKIDAVKNNAHTNSNGYQHSIKLRLLDYRRGYWIIEYTPCPGKNGPLNKML